MARARGEVPFRAVVSSITLSVAVLTLVASLSTSKAEPRSFYIWPAIWFFLAWRFFRLGCYTSPWGVRICNPVLTFWYPWRKIDHFELGSTGEMFAPKAQAVIMVTDKGKRRTIWSLATSMLFFRLSEAKQKEVLSDLNGRVATASREEHR